MTLGFNDETDMLPDMLIEVVSPKNRMTDLRDKRREYAQAGIPECWIVGPQPKTVTALKLSGETYAVHGAYGQGDIAESALLDGFRVDVDDIWRAASGASSLSNC
ncbi:MAG: Uma2 family endonuclease [Thermoflexales bacterium]